MILKNLSNISILLRNHLHTAVIFFFKLLTTTNHFKNIISAALKQHECQVPHFNVIMTTHTLNTTASDIINYCPLITDDHIIIIEIIAI